MLRAVVSAGVVIVLVCVAIFGSGLFKAELADAEALQLEECNLLAGPCEWSGTNGHWRVELSKPANTGQPQDYLLEVTTPNVPERFLAVLRGESMYMGEYPIPLSKKENDNGVYVAHFTSPVCSTGEDMIWRVDLQQGQKAIAHIPIKMVFQATH